MISAKTVSDVRHRVANRTLRPRLHAPSAWSPHVHPRLAMPLQPRCHRPRPSPLAACVAEHSCPSRHHAIIRSPDRRRRHAVLLTPSVAMSGRTAAAILSSAGHGGRRRLGQQYPIQLVSVLSLMRLPLYATLSYLHSSMTARIQPTPCSRGVMVCSCTII
jgi:hypothetical protein